MSKHDFLELQLTLTKMVNGKYVIFYFQLSNLDLLESSMFPIYDVKKSDH